jgi:hypothetical protein
MVGKRGRKEEKTSKAEERAGKKARGADTVFSFVVPPEDPRKMLRGQAGCKVKKKQKNK